jgi:hypothetical protein
MHASSLWPVRTSVHAWDDAPDIHTVYQHDCSSYRQVVRVYSGRYGKTGHWYGRVGEAMLRWSGGRFISPLWIKLNTTYGASYSWSSRLHVISHEIGHTLGEDHTTHWRSVMRPGAYEYARPQPYDFAEIDRLYPW